jgi:hypothetical protein
LVCGLLFDLFWLAGGVGFSSPAAAAISGATRMTDKSRAADNLSVDFMRPLLDIDVMIIHRRRALLCGAAHYRAKVIIDKKTEARE